MSFVPPPDEIGAAMRAGIRNAVRQLTTSERGRSVAGDLHELLDGPIAHLDCVGWQCLHELLGAYEHGYAGSVLEALYPFAYVREEVRKS